MNSRGREKRWLLLNIEPTTTWSSTKIALFLCVFAIVGIDTNEGFCLQQRGSSSSRHSVGFSLTGPSCRLHPLGGVDAQRYYPYCNIRRTLLVLFESPTAHKSESSESGTDAQDNNEEEDKEDELLWNEDFTIEPTKGSQQLIARITENYVFGKEDRDFTVDEMLAVIEKDFRIREVPVQIGEAIFDASTTGIEIDQSISEILSFAAYHGLPKRLTAELLDASLGDPFATARKVFLKEGWKSVTFPKGLAIQPQTARRKMFAWVTNKQQRTEEAIRAVRAAAAARSPFRQLENPKPFLSKLASEEYTTDLRPQKGLTFFPNKSSFLKLGRVRRLMDRTSSRVKTKGKAGVLAYAMFNFVLYSIGMLWQWRSIAHAEITATSNALIVTIRKFGRVFGTILLVSNLLKIPKLLSVAGLVPVADRLLKFSREKTGLSDTRLVVILVSMLVSAWMLLMAVPVLSEFSRMRKLIYLEKVFDQYAVEPAAYLTTGAYLTVA